MADIGQEKFCPQCGNEVRKALYRNGQLEEGTILNRRYIVGQELARDKVGITYVAWDATREEKIAIREWFPKKYCRRGANGSDVESDMDQHLWANLQKQFLDVAEQQGEGARTPMLICTFDLFRQNGTAYYTMEYPAGKTLRELLKKENPLPAGQAQEIYGCIAKAVEKMHIHGIIHGNLTPDNILLTENNGVKFLNRSWKSYETEQVGNVFFLGNYAAPEWYPGAAPSGQDADAYSLAAVYYRMVTGIEPYSYSRRIQGEAMLTPSNLGIRMNAEDEAMLQKELGIMPGQKAPVSPMAGGARESRGGFPVRSIVLAVAGVAVVAAIGVGLIFAFSKTSGKKNKETLQTEDTVQQETEPGETETGGKEQESEDGTEQPLKMAEGANTDLKDSVKDGEKTPKQIEEELQAEADQIRAHYPGTEIHILTDMEGTGNQDEMIDQEETDGGLQKGGEIRYLFFAERYCIDTKRVNVYNEEQVRPIVAERNSSQYNVTFGSAFAGPDDSGTMLSALDGLMKKVNDNHLEIEWTSADDFSFLPTEGAKLLERIYLGDVNGDETYEDLAEWTKEGNEQNILANLNLEKDLEGLEFISCTEPQKAEYFACMNLPDKSRYLIVIMADGLEKGSEEEQLKEMVTALCSILAQEVSR